MLKLLKDLKILSIKTCKDHSRIRILMIDISVFINSDGPCEAVYGFKLFKCFMKCLLKTHSVGGSRYDLAAVALLTISSPTPVQLTAQTELA